MIAGQMPERAAGATRGASRRMMVRNIQSIKLVCKRGLPMPTPSPTPMSVRSVRRSRRTCSKRCPTRAYPRPGDPVRQRRSARRSARSSPRPGSNPLLSQHLAVLKRHRVVRAERVGNAVFYELAHPSVSSGITDHRPDFFWLTLCGLSNSNSKRSTPCPRRGAAVTAFGAQTARRLLPHQGRLRRPAAIWRRDVLAGITVGVVALPSPSPSGISSGVGAAAGLITAVVAGLVAAVFAGSPVRVSGPPARWRWCWPRSSPSTGSGPSPR